METWQPGETALVVALASVTLAFATYHFLIHSPWFKKQISLRFGPERSPVQQIVFQRFAGLILMGFLPLLVAMNLMSEGLSYFGWNVQHIDQVLLWTLGASVIVLPLNYLNARSAFNLSMYPQMRVREWTWPLLLWSNLTWVLYLVGYETLFRGILFFPVLDHYGLIPAIAINATIYSLAHIPKGLRETIGAIPFGILVCIACYQTGNLLFPLFIHCIMALSNEMMSVYFHPEMHLKKSV
jgi:membrane protease YdiL (CAAX protease family)